MPEMSRLMTIFREAVNITDRLERIQYLDRECGSDASMKLKIMDMLQKLEENPSLPELPTPSEETAVQGNIPSSQSSPIYNLNYAEGTVINGRYKIIQELGEGGMGTVYHAKLISNVKMGVALKVIKPGMDTKQILSRFGLEQKALAMMNHPNITKFTDCGMTEDGRPYFVMELLNGKTLTKFCDERKLSVEDRLRLFTQICSGVQHAHHKGIVHRDLKPNNIIIAMYDDKPVVKIIDFGLAKAVNNNLLEDSVDTHIGTFMGTVVYAAPEQAMLNNLDVDTRADIYSLGVILYELLTGTTPIAKDRLKSAARDAILQLLQNEDPVKPSTKIGSSDQLPSIAALRQIEPVKLTRMVKGDLDWIVMKALERNREKRYVSASEFAKDIEHFLHGEPTGAVPPSWGYTASKFYHKHQAKILGAAAVLGLILTAGIVSSIGWLQASEQRQIAESNEKTAKEKEAIAKAVNDFWSEITEGADPNVSVTKDQPFNKDLTLSTVLDRATNKIGTRFIDQPLIEAAIQHSLGKTYIGLGALNKADYHLKRAEELKKKGGQEKTSSMLETKYELAWLRVKQDNMREASIIFGQILSEPHASIRMKLRCEHGLGCIETWKENTKNGTQKLEQVLASQKASFGSDDLDTLRTWRDFSGGLNSLNDPRAESELLQASSRFEKQFSESHPDAMTTKNNLGMYYQRKRTAESLTKAETIYNNLIDSTAKMYGTENIKTSTYMANLAAVYYGMKEYPKALSMYEKVYSLNKTLQGDVHEDTIETGLALAACFHNTSQKAKMIETHDAIWNSASNLLPRKDKIALLDRLIGVYARIQQQDRVQHFTMLKNGI